MGGSDASFLPFSECCGALEYYDKAFDRITTRSEKPLRSIKRIFHTVTTTDDPVIRKVQWTGGFGRKAYGVKGGSLHGDSPRGN